VARTGAPRHRPALGPAVVVVHDHRLGHAVPVEPEAEIDVRRVVPEAERSPVVGHLDAVEPRGDGAVGQVEPDPVAEVQPAPLEGSRAPEDRLPPLRRLDGDAQLPAAVALSHDRAPALRAVVAGLLPLAGDEPDVGDREVRRHVHAERVFVGLAEARPQLAPELDLRPLRRLAVAPDARHVALAHLHPEGGGAGADDVTLHAEPSRLGPEPPEGPERPLLEALEDRLRRGGDGARRDEERGGQQARRARPRHQASSVFSTNSGGKGGPQT
jgi:hypothetical protein